MPLLKCLSELVWCIKSSVLAAEQAMMGKHAKNLTTCFREHVRRLEISKISAKINLHIVGFMIKLFECRIPIKLKLLCMILSLNVKRIVSHLSLLYIFSISIFFSSKGKNNSRLIIFIY